MLPNWLQDYLQHSIPTPWLVVLALVPGFAYRAARRGRFKESELHIRWPWWRRRWF